MKKKLKYIGIFIAIVCSTYILFWILYFIKLFWINSYYAEKKASEYEEVEVRMNYFYNHEDSFMNIVNLLEKYPSIGYVNISANDMCFLPFEKKVKLTYKKYLCVEQEFDDELIDLEEIYEIMSDIDEIVSVSKEIRNDEDFSIRFYLASSFDMVVYYEYCLSDLCSTDNESHTNYDNSVYVTTQIDENWSTVFAGRYLHYKK